MKIRAAGCFILLLIIIQLSACSFPQSGKAVGADKQVGSTRTWIDAPLNGSTIPFKSYEIVIHTFGSAGVTQVELSANGNVLANLSNSDPGKQLATLKYAWLPATPGNYTLRARAQSKGGAWDSETSAVVTVSNFTVTPVNTSTATVTLTPIGTFTPTGTATPTVTSTVAELSFTPRISTSTFYYGTCGSNQVTIQVLVPGDTVASVVLFTHLQDQAGGGKTDWDEGSSMNPSGGGWFSRTISSRSVAGADRFENAWLLYQFVATDRSGKVIGRSQTYSDITLASCSKAQPPSRIITNTPGLIIIVPPILRIPTATLIPSPR
jgi:hypothetical protein